MKLKIISWNIWYDGNFEEISQFLETSQADLIGLQEVVSNDSTRDIIGYLRKLGYDSLFAPAFTLEDGRIVGNAIFSKQKIVTSKVYTLSEIDSRNAVKVDIKVNDVSLHIFNTHLLHTDQRPSEIQDTQVDCLIKTFSTDRTIVLGDFNAMPDSSVIQKMRAIMVDTDPDSAPTLYVDLFDCPDCDPKTIANTRLDYIFTSKDIKTNTFKVEHSNGSDHLPVSVIVEI